MQGVSKVLNVRFNEEEYEWLRKQAYHKKISLSSFVRKLVQTEIEKSDIIGGCENATKI
jgi:predicted HicB family RNase H-like nuclease